jgi:hypothetical protein
LFSFFPSVNSLVESSSVCSVQYKRKRQIYTHRCTVFFTINLLIETQRVCVGMTTEGGKSWSLRASATAPSHSSTTPGRRPRPHTGIVSASKHRRSEFFSQKCLSCSENHVMKSNLLICLYFICLALNNLSDFFSKKTCLIYVHDIGWPGSTQR